MEQRNSQKNFNLFVSYESERNFFVCIWGTKFLFVHLQSFHPCLNFHCCLLKKESFQLFHTSPLRKSTSSIEQRHRKHPTFLIIVEHPLIVWGSSGQRQGVMPKLGFYEGFYIHLMILQASVSWVNYPYMPVLSSFNMLSHGWVNNVHSAYNIQDYTRQTA